MKIAYIKTKWEDKKTPVNAINLGNIENTLEKVTEGALGIDQLKADPGIVINEDTDNNEIRVGIDPGFIVTPGNLTTEINKINADIIEETERAKEAELKNHNSITFLQTQLNNIVNGDASSAIESFNEILEFLSSISDSTTLAGIVSQLNNSIQAEVTRATAAETINSQLISSLQTSVNGIISGNISIHTAISNLQAVIQNVAENGFNVIDPSGNIGLKYDENGLDVALLSTHFQGLINTLISTLITAAKGTTLAPLVNSLIPSTYLPSYVDDVVDIDIFGTTAIAQYCSDNDGNTATLADKFCYDDENKVLVIARQINNTIDLVNSTSPESGKIYLDITANVSYRWSGTTMAEISNSISLGETANTAYAGDKGKLNADNIIRHTTLITALSSVVSSLSSLILQVSEIGYYVTDANGNVGMKCDESGFDVALLSDHIKSLIRQIDGISGNLTLGETTGTAYDGGKGSMLKTLLTKLSSSVSNMQENISETTETGYYIADSNGNVGMKYDENGLDAALLSSHFQGLIKSIDGLGSQALSINYSYANDFIKHNYYSLSVGASGTITDGTWNTNALMSGIRIPVYSGDVISANTDGSGGILAWGLSDENDILYSISNANISGIISFTISKNGYIYVNSYNSQAAFVNITRYKFALIDIVSKLSENIFNLNIGPMVNMRNPSFPYHNKSAKVLVIGNSYTDDGMAYLPDLVTASGIDVTNFSLYKIYVGGASLKTYSDYLDSGSNLYANLIVGNSSMTTATTAPLQTIFANKWDIIILQQSHDNISNLGSYSPYLVNIVKAIRKNCPTNPCVGMNMVWAYMTKPTDGIIGDLQFYENVRSMRYLNRFGIDYIVPVGNSYSKCKAF